MSSAEERIVSTLIESMQQQKNKTESYDTPATVRRVEGDTAWVHIPGGIDETPVKLTINAAAGDTVQVRVSGGRAFLVGNASAPPTDDKRAVQAQQAADTAAEVAEAADEAAQTSLKMAVAAKQIADNTNQYFWHTEEGTDTGAHITEIPREDFLADPDNGGGNLLARSNGIALREGLVELATFQQSGLEIKSYNLAGNEVEVAHIGYGETQGASGTVQSPYFTFGSRRSSLIGERSFAEGYEVEASERYSHAEGMNTHATAMASHAEGRSTTASSQAAHAEGYGARATNMYAHAEGYNSVASGGQAHAEGFETVASGSDSHAQNNGTIAAGKAQTALGEFNVADTPASSIQRGQYAVIVGNGTADNARSNALTVDWTGNVEAAGDITDGSGKKLSDMPVVLFDTTTGWQTAGQAISAENTIYVWTDYQQDEDGNDVAGFKVGDGLGYIIDLPFVDAPMQEHMTDTVVHITQTEREFWNNKERTYVIGETLYLTKQ